MACDPDSGQLRELLPEEEPKGKEVLFRQGENFEIKGCLFELVNIYPNPENIVMLKGIPKRHQT